ncbi:polysaccharide deacetylase family protein [Streptosporangium lutulentum]
MRAPRAPRAPRPTSARTAGHQRRRSGSARRASTPASPTPGAPTAAPCWTASGSGSRSPPTAPSCPPLARPPTSSSPPACSVAGTGPASSRPPPAPASAARATRPSRTPATALAIQFDDGPSHYRTETLRILREKQVTGVFMDTGTRVEANPHFARFQLAEGHELLNHTYSHANLNQVLVGEGPDGVRREIQAAEAAFAAVGAPISFRGIRPPFGAANAQVRQIIADMGYTDYMTRIGTDDWLPERTPQEISDAIVEQLYPGAIISLHDGPYDTTAPGHERGLALLIDAARERGYCFGTVDRHGGVVADRLIPTGKPIPVVENPVPYAPLVSSGEPPKPYVILD